MNGNANGDLSKSSMDVSHANGDRKKRSRNNAKHNNEITKRKKADNFEFGNYNRYYGYRIQNGHGDLRLNELRQRLKLFVNKDILDIGCNIGHVTYSLARDFFPKSVLGIDIDNTLIKIARKNLHFYCDPRPASIKALLENLDFESKELVSNSDSTLRFPDNVSFLHVNYVLYSDELLTLEEPKYDVILCLSVSKWIHLNWGDEGLKRSFKRIFLQLRNGGTFILEAQPFESYQKKKLCAKLRGNSRKLKFLPSMFENYLLNEIGFSSCEMISVPSLTSRGFQRPIQLFFKS